MLKMFWIWKNDEKVLDIELEKDVLDEENEWQIALDIIETSSSLVILAPIAWLELDEIDITLNKSKLIISWERTKPDIFYSEDSILRNSECYRWKFSRNIILPENLDFDKIKAVMENNLLIVTIPKLHISTQNIKINRIWEKF